MAVYTSYERIVRRKAIWKGERANAISGPNETRTSGSSNHSRRGTAFIEQYIFPTLELCKKLQDEKKILAGGPTSGAVGLVLIVNAESARELDDLITTLPVWPRMETAVVPLTLLKAGRKAFGRG